MTQKWGSNEDIHIGDIFHEWSPWDEWQLYYQVTALRGRTQVVLQAIESEYYINEGIQEDSPLYWRRKRERPLPGKFLPVDNPMVTYGFWIKDKYTELTQEVVTAWVLPERSVEGWPQLRAVGLAWKKFGVNFNLVLPEDWEPWDAETIRRLEEEDRAEQEELRRSLLENWKAGGVS